jgi:hypothetical protein
VVFFGSKNNKLVLPQVGEVDLPETSDDFQSLGTHIANKLLKVLPTEQDNWWFLTEQFDRSQSFGDTARRAMDLTSIRLHEIEFEGNRSEQSYVGAPNAGVVLLQAVKKALGDQFSVGIAELVIATAYLQYVNACAQMLNGLRLKYAVHFHNNCVKSQSFNNAEKWHDVIRSLGNE